MPKNQEKFFVNNTRITLSRLSKVHFLYFFLYHARSIGGGGGAKIFWMSLPPLPITVFHFFFLISMKEISHQVNFEIQKYIVYFDLHPASKIKIFLWIWKIFHGYISAVYKTSIIPLYLLFYWSLYIVVD